MDDLGDARGGVLLGKMAKKGVLGNVGIRDNRWVCVTWKNGIARAYGGETLLAAVQKAAEAEGVES